MSISGRILPADKALVVIEGVLMPASLAIIVFAYPTKLSSGEGLLSLVGPFGLVLVFGLLPSITLGLFIGFIAERVRWFAFMVEAFSGVVLTYATVIGYTGRCFFDLGIKGCDKDVLALILALLSAQILVFIEWAMILAGRQFRTN